ncbi:helix-turn-helix domain-containing protein [Rufibacter psychrotolerans]|uniref:helix-turn-helix domain-containing protein n=1 Tax=Rufibacter psychrotolerans TaxID=2812556 RepID=UPI001967B559|nr:AraC family transcriptional regulator [Rufibacter sp. SYSU D00308]
MADHAQLSTSQSLYSGSCEMLHVNSQNYNTLKQARSPNRIMSSCFHAFDATIRPRGLALKYVAQGQETFWVQRKRHQITKGTYLLVNETIPTVDTVIKDANTWSVCVDFDVALVNEVLQHAINPNDLDSHHHLSAFLLTPDLFVQEAVAGAPLQRLLNSYIPLAMQPAQEVPAVELLYDLAALLLREQLAVATPYYKLQTAKSSTRKELFRRLWRGKELLQDSVGRRVTMQQVAQECCLSEFRFYRLFRQCFGVSPFQFLHARRIEKSLELRQQGLDWTEIAFQLNFTDGAAFSKAFKKMKGVAPSKFPL